MIAAVGFGGGGVEIGYNKLVGPARILVAQHATDPHGHDKSGWADGVILYEMRQQFDAIPSPFILGCRIW
jgi:hypothetical protein